MPRRTGCATLGDVRSLLALLILLLPVAGAAAAGTVSMQGDSLSAVSRPFFAPQGMHVVSYDAESGRSFQEGWRHVRTQRLGDVVVFALGTNNLAINSPSDFIRTLRQVLTHIGPERCLVVPDLYAHGTPRHWNHRIRDLAADVGPRRMYVAPWARWVREGRVRLVDGVHPSQEADWRTRARLVAAAVRQCRAAQQALPQSK